MKIKDGYNNKEMEIIIIGNHRIGEFWIKSEALERGEMLNYITLEELLDLKQEINEVLKEMVGLK